jgi:hypothetical protein
MIKCTNDGEELNLDEETVRKILDRIITGDESWCFQYEPEKKCQSMQWKTSASLRPKKAHVTSPSEDKAHLFFLTYMEWNMGQPNHK